MTRKFEGNFFNAIELEKNAFGQYGLSMAKVDRSGTIQDCRFSVSKGVPAGEVFNKTMHNVTEEELQLLMDEIWTIGIRPTGFKPPSPVIAQPANTQEAYLAGKVDGMKEHLDDMRMLAGILPRPTEATSPDAPMTGRGGTI